MDSSEKTSIQSEDEADMEKLAAVMAQLASSQQQFQQQLVNSQQQFQQLQQEMQHQNQVQQQELQQQIMDQQQKQQKEFQKILKEMDKRPTARNERVNVAEYKEGEDIVSFLEAFKGTMTLNEVEEDWLKYLVPSLTGKAREVSRYMEFDKCTYRDLKERLMRHFEVTTEAQRWKFREKKWTTESTPEAYVREAEQLI